MSEKQVIQPDQSGFFQKDQFKIYWEYFGKGDKEVFCLMNGVAMYTKSWYSFLPLFSKDYDILLFDFFGQGQSSHEAEIYDLDYQCSLLNILLESLNIKKIHLTGVSYGGMAALEFVRKYQEKVMSCTVSGIVLTVEELFLLDVENCVRLIQDAPFDLFASVFFHRIFGEQLARKTKQLFQYTKDKWHERYKGKEKDLMKIYRSMGQFVENSEKNQKDFQSVKTPVLVIAGEEDIYTPLWIQKKAVEILPNSRIETMKNVGHVVYMENPIEYANWAKKLATAKSVSF